MVRIGLVLVLVTLAPALSAQDRAGILDATCPDWTEVDPSRFDTPTEDQLLDARDVLIACTPDLTPPRVAIGVGGVAALYGLAAAGASVAISDARCDYDGICRFPLGGVVASAILLGGGGAALIVGTRRLAEARPALQAVRLEVIRIHRKLDRLERGDAAGVDPARLRVVPMLGTARGVSLWLHF